MGPRTRVPFVTGPFSWTVALWPSSTSRWVPLTARGWNPPKSDTRCEPPFFLLFMLISGCYIAAGNRDLFRYLAATCNRIRRVNYGCVPSLNHPPACRALHSRPGALGKKLRRKITLTKWKLTRRAWHSPRDLFSNSILTFCYLNLGFSLPSI